MIPTSFDESNFVFDKPKNTPRDKCDALSTWVGPSQEGDQVIISCWKPTQEELDEINRTGRIWVYHWGNFLQPHSVSGVNPFK